MTKLDTIMTFQRAQNKVEEAYNALENAIDELKDIFASTYFCSTFDDYTSEIKDDVEGAYETLGDIMDKIELIKNADEYWEDDDNLEAVMCGEEPSEEDEDDEEEEEW